MAARWDHTKIAVTEHLLAAGLSEGEVEDKLAVQWKVRHQVARRYVALVKARWAEDAALEVDARRAQLTVMALDVYRECRRRGHARTALAAIDTVARLNGVTVQVATTTIFDSRGEFTSPQAIADRLRELRAKQLGSGGGGEDQGGGGN